MNGLDLGQEVYALFSEGLFKETWWDTDIYPSSLKLYYDYFL